MASPPAEAAHSLLHRDEEALDRVAQVLGRDRPAFAIVVCPAALRPLALAYLRGKTGRPLPAPKAPRDAEHLLEMLAAQAGMPGGPVLSLDFGEEPARLLATLNLHREKLRSGGRTVVWLAAVDDLRAVHEVAPDAYSFRDAVAIVQGAPVLPALVPEGESEELVARRTLFDQAQDARTRANAAAWLAAELRLEGRFDEAEAIAREGWEALSGPQDDDDAGRDRRAHLCSQFGILAAGRGAQARARRWILRGLVETESMERPSRSRPWLLAQLPGPYSRDRVRAQAGLDEVARNGARDDVQHSLLLTLAHNALRRGDLRDAQRRLRAATKLRVHPFNRAVRESAMAELGLAAGRLGETERWARTAASSFSEAHAIRAFTAVLFASCLRQRGEVESAHRTLDQALAEIGPSSPTRMDLRMQLARLSLSTGDARCLAELRQVIRTATESGADSVHHDGCTILADAAIALHAADFLTGADVRAVEADLAVAQDASFSMVGDDPPWYVIRFPGLRSEVLSALPSSRPAAISLAEQALARARADWPELAPEQGRRLLSALLAAGRTADVLRELPAIEAEARREEIFVELVKILRLGIAAAVAEQRAPEVDRASAALREALAATDSPRLTAETLLDLAASLPPAATAPDPIALAEEAHALFLEMPMPAGEARALEVAGDVLAARGQAEDARRRYRAAHRKLTRYGLGLRVPTLEKKLAGM